MDENIKKETQTEIEIEITDEEFLILAKIAHKKDITFNQLINDILRNKMEQEKSSSYS